MTHKDKGHFSDKHEGETINKAYADKLAGLSSDGIITCAAAHKVAESLNVPPEQIGIQIDLLELRITRCQLGLFGYTTNSGKKLDAGVQINDDLETELKNSVTNGHISCKMCWDIAAAAKAKRLDIGSVCEKNQIRIKPCQLGTF